MPNALLVDVPDRFETDRFILRTPRTGDGPVLHEALVESIVELRQFLWFLPWVAEERTPNLRGNTLPTLRSKLPQSNRPAVPGLRAFDWHAVGRDRTAPHGLGPAKDRGRLLDQTI